MRPKGASTEDPTNQRESEAAQGYIVRVEDGRIRKFGIAFLFSTVILLRIGFRDTTISGRVGRLNLRHLVTFEWWLGLALVAALTITLANTQPLLNKLITGVF